jgi:plasmid stability protein
MKALTIRNIPPEIAREIRKRASESGMSASGTILELVREALGLGKAKKFKVVHKDLDFLIGSATQDEVREMRASLKAQRQIDPEDWQ